MSEKELLIISWIHRAGAGPIALSVEELRAAFGTCNPSIDLKGPFKMC